MIRTEKEYRASLKKLKQTEEAIRKQEEHLEGMALSPKDHELVMSPMLNFCRQLQSQVETYEQVKSRA